MITGKDAASVAEALARNLLGVSKDSANFRGLPDSFWGYFARGHDQKGRFGVFVAYSEDGADIDSLVRQYEAWAASRGGSAAAAEAAAPAEPPADAPAPGVRRPGTASAEQEAASAPEPAAATGVRRPGTASAEQEAASAPEPAAMEGFWRPGTVSWGEFDATGVLRDLYKDLPYVRKLGYSIGEMSGRILIRAIIDYKDDDSFLADSLEVGRKSREFRDMLPPDMRSAYEVVPMVGNEEEGGMSHFRRITAVIDR